jgi:hypothetical protein
MSGTYMGVITAFYRIVGDNSILPHRGGLSKLLVVRMHHFDAPLGGFG